MRRDVWNEGELTLYTRGTDRKIRRVSVIHAHEIQIAGRTEGLPSIFRSISRGIQVLSPLSPSFESPNDSMEISSIHSNAVVKNNNKESYCEPDRGIAHKDPKSSPSMSNVRAPFSILNLASDPSGNQDPYTSSILSLQIIRAPCYSSPNSIVQKKEKRTNLSA